MGLLITIICLGLVVVVHEYGHLLVAKYFKVKIERFTVGFGPELIGWTAKDNIRYSICAIPLGGMVKMAGEYVEERTNAPDEFFSQPWYRRILIALAGPAMNYVLAFFLFALVAGVWGILEPTSHPIIGNTIVGYPADKAGLLPGDRIVTIENQPMKSWKEMAEYINARPDQKLKVTVERPGSTTPVKLTLTPQKDTTRGVGLIGVMPQMDKVKPGFLGSLSAGYRDVKAWTVQPLQYMGQKIKNWEGPKELSGPLGIAHMVTKATKEGVSYVIYLIAIISTGLGLFNLFPIPVLDGGHVLLYTIEGIRRRPMSARSLQMINLVGLVFVLTIFVYASYHDIVRWNAGFWK